MWCCRCCEQRGLVQTAEVAVQQSAARQPQPVPSGAALTVPRALPRRRQLPRRHARRPRRRQDRARQPVHDLRVHQRLRPD